MLPFCQKYSTFNVKDAMNRKDLIFLLSCLMVYLSYNF
jgi:hypothetical protein